MTRDEFLSLALRNPVNGAIADLTPMGLRRDDNYYRTTPEVNPALRRGGLMSFFKKQCASFPA